MTWLIFNESAKSLDSQVAGCVLCENEGLESGRQLQPWTTYKVACVERRMTRAFASETLGNILIHFFP